MLKKSLLLLAVAASCATAQVHAQAAAPSSPAKKELVSRILKLQQPAFESLARELTSQPANELIGGALDYVQTQVAADKREAMAKGLQQDAEKYMSETYPLVRDRAMKLAPTTVGALLEEKFSEEELKQVVGILESPVYSKFQKLGGDMQRALVSKLVPDAKPAVEPKLRALDQAFATRLGVKPIASGGAGGAAPAASGGKK